MPDWNRPPGNWQNHCVGSLTCGPRVVKAERCKQKLLGRPLLPVPEGTARASATAKDWKDARTVMPSTSSLNLPVGPAERQQGLGERLHIFANLIRGDSNCSSKIAGVGVMGDRATCSFNLFMLRNHFFSIWHVQCCKLEFREYLARHELL